ncbi:MAG TPA: tol-pal system-associated acyl-CoA thioesterase [Burkholderiales bacterium]|nr:tol-pal system-associated acyl-CoA thioesterase [Burkholderiales bacterium]
MEPSIASPAGAAEPFVWPVRVYYEDTDAAGVVYYANYLRFTERARTEWLRALGFEQPDLAAQHRVVFVVRSVAIDYLVPARFNDELQVTVELIKVGAGQIDLIQRVLRGDALLARAAVKIVCVGLPAMRPVRIPQALATIIRTRI